MKTTEIFPIGEKMTSFFTGDAWVEMLSTDVANYDVLVYNVTFAPGSRNFWHLHAGGQILLCTSGEGYYQEKGKPIQLLKTGDVVEIKPDVLHWHGASPNSGFTHVGITPKASENAPTWYEAVSDNEYGNAEK